MTVPAPAATLGSVTPGGRWSVTVRWRVATTTGERSGEDDERRDEHRAAVRFEKVQKSYDGSVLVVKDLNLDIAPGEFLTMLGPSGSGKTTCLMMLAGFEPATHGEIFLDDEPINNVPPHKRGIGMVFQNYALFPHMSVAENLAFPLELRNMDKSTQREKVQRALDMVELGAFGNRRPAQLSGGQQQRVAVARALVFDPDLVLMDEPLGALDKQLREQMQYEIKHIHESLGVTVVYVTHDQSEALTMSDRVAVFEDGVIQQLSRPDELYESPRNSFVRPVHRREQQALPAPSLGIDGTRCRRRARRRHAGSSPTPSTCPRAGGADDAVAPPRADRARPRGGARQTSSRGRIREIIYHGDHLRVVMTVAGDDDFVVKVRNRGERRPLEAGQVHRLGWAASDGKALDAVADAGAVPGATEVAA